MASSESGGATRGEPGAPYHSAYDTQGRIWQTPESHSTEAGTRTDTRRPHCPPPGPALSRELLSDAMYLPPPGPALSRKLPSDTVYRPTPGPTQAPLLSLYTCTVLSCCHAGEVQCRQPAQSAQCLEASYGGSLLTAGGTHGCFHWPGAPPSGGRALCRFTCHQALWFCPSGPQVPGQATSRPRGGRQQCP